ncbi:unnamed protein product [Blepharisma stoltei]|uniref:Acetyl-CoA acetyltransferase n=1 Tax=Blepharisma stoltei TaxID=1481888 RepID=A0AAU9I8H8_9CILI|nr:unnamed protein product [Blepharisma stoltei]
MLKASHRVFLAAGKRTPFGFFVGTFAKIPAPILCAHSILGVFSSTKIKPHEISSAIYGCGIQSGLGHNPTKQALLAANLPDDIPCTTINQGHCSGSKSVILAYQEIALGHSDIVLCGGYDSVSLSPFNIKKGRNPTTGDILAEDCYIKDGLHNPFYNTHAGIILERTNLELTIPLIDQDIQAKNQYKKRDIAYARNYHEKEIFPFGNENTDELYGKVTQKDNFSKPLYYKQGTVNAYTAATPGDGACSLLLVSEEKLKSLELTPIAEIVKTAEIAISSNAFPKANSEVAKKVLYKLGWTFRQVNLWEVNDYYSGLDLAFAKYSGVLEELININGSTLAIGDPMAASSARQVLSLSLALKERSLKKGVAVSCEITGGATAIAIQVVD